MDIIVKKVDYSLVFYSLRANAATQCKFLLILQAPRTSRVLQAAGAGRCETVTNNELSTKVASVVSTSQNRECTRSTGGL